jgi:hypothetical protein
MWAARILLLGILALAAIAILSQAIVFAAPYLAALIVLSVAGIVIYAILEDSEPKD